MEALGYMETYKGKEAIGLRINIADKTGRLIPHGVTETVNILIIDGLATFRFKDGRICKRMASVSSELEKKNNAPETTIWIERLQQALTKYPGKSKEEIRDSLVSQFEKWGGRIA